MVYLPVEQAVIVPSTKGVKSQKKVSDAEFRRRVNNVRRFLARRYGGFTDVQQTGGFVLKNGKLVREKVVRVGSFATRKDDVKHKKALMNQIHKWREKWGQESVGYEREGDLYVVEPTKTKVIKRIKKKRLKSPIKKLKRKKK